MLILWISNLNKREVMRLTSININPKRWSLIRVLWINLSLSSINLGRWESSSALSFFLDYLFDTDKALGSKDDDVFIHCIKFFNCFCLENIDINVIQNLKSKCFLQGIWFNLHREASKSRRANLLDIIVLESCIHIVNHLTWRIDQLSWNVREGMPSKWRELGYSSWLILVLTLIEML